MKYKDFEGTIEELVELKLREIEEKEHVRILHAVESGSRSWGFASPDSDYDVRFIYVRRKEDYLRLDVVRDVIEWELDEVLDINGWDLKKTLQQYHRSNATLFEWANSPVVYRTTPEWEEISREAAACFSVKASMYHYYGTAKSNYMEFLQGEEVKYKKYFYVIRPLLACRWIEERQCPPPVLFSRLMETELEDTIRPEVERLLELKLLTPESGKGKRLDTLNQYISEKLDYYEKLLAGKKDDREDRWELLNGIFMKAVSAGD